MWSAAAASPGLLPLLLLLHAASPAASAERPPPRDGLALPDFIQPCRRSDPHLNSCLRDSFNAFVRGGAAGAEVLAMPSLDPLRIPFLDLSSTVPGNLTLWLVLWDVVLRGFSNSHVVAVRANLAEQKMEVTSRAPLLRLEGNFSSFGAVLTFPLSAQGSFSVNMTEVSTSWIAYFSEKPIRADGPNHIVIDHYEFDFAPVDVSYHFGDTLDDDDLLGEAMNGFLNANALELLGDAKARAAALLGPAVGAVAGAALRALPADRLLLPDDER